MRTQILLLAAGAAIPAASQAELIVNSTWEQTAAIPGAISSNFSFQMQQPGMVLRAAQFNVRNPMGQMTAMWQLNSVKIDGITNFDPTYTPNAADFELVIFSSGTNSVVGTASASAVGSLVDNGDYSSRFDITFTNITGQPTFGPLTGYMDGSYLLYLKLAAGSTLNTNFIQARGFLPTQTIDVFGTPSQAFPGTVSTISWIGPSPLVIDATNAFGAPVPEPSTYGLMLGGLALVAVAVRRRNKAKA